MSDIGRLNLQLEAHRKDLEHTESLLENPLLEVEEAGRLWLRQQTLVHLIERLEEAVERAPAEAAKKTAQGASE